MHLASGVSAGTGGGITSGIAYLGVGGIASAELGHPGAGLVSSAVDRAGKCRVAVPFALLFAPFKTNSGRNRELSAGAWGDLGYVDHWPMGAASVRRSGFAQWLVCVGWLVAGEQFTHRRDSCGYRVALFISATAAAQSAGGRVTRAYSGLAVAHPPAFSVYQ